MRSIRVLFISGAIILLTSSAFAHPPSDIRISYNESTKMLTAVIIHPVNDTKSHYIKRVEVSLNGQKIIEQKISRQDNENDQGVSYFIPDAKPGDKISVEAYCSVSGKLIKEIKLKRYLLFL